jgi:hypothetical protein
MNIFNKYSKNLDFLSDECRRKAMNDKSTIKSNGTTTFLLTIITFKIKLQYVLWAPLGQRPGLNDHAGPPLYGSLYISYVCMYVCVYILM